MLALALLGIALALVAGSRGYPGYGTESDLLGGFIPEAERFRQGAPLVMDFQPPLYPFLLFLGRIVISDWFQVGLVLSWVTALLTIWIGYLFFRELFSPAAGVGSAVALATSGTFLAFAVQATSDVPFLFFYTATLWAAWRISTGSRPFWWAAATGALIGLSLLFRVNGLPLTLLVLAPWVASGTPGARWRWTGALLGGWAAVFLVWGSYAGVTGSPLYPTDNYANLAMTYYGEGDRLSVEDRLEMEERFSSTLEVLTHDPVTVARRYAGDLLNTTRVLFTSDRLTAFPLGVLALPGVLLLVLLRPSPFQLLFLVLTVGHVLLLNLKTFEPRYYLFMIPLLGAGAGVLVHEGARILRRPHRWVAGAVLLGLLLTGFHASVRGSYRDLVRYDEELSEAIPATRALIGADAIVVARKRHIPHHAGATRWFLPPVESVEELLEAMAAEGFRDPVYLYFGQTEWGLRPGLRDLRTPEKAPAELELLIRGSKSPWTLYRYVGTQPFQ